VDGGATSASGAQAGLETKCGNGIRAPGGVSPPMQHLRRARRLCTLLPHARAEPHVASEQQGTLLRGVPAEVRSLPGSGVGLVVGLEDGNATPRLSIRLSPRQSQSGSLFHHCGPGSHDWITIVGVLA
jgi:hypothetical protein